MIVWESYNSDNLEAKKKDKYAIKIENASFSWNKDGDACLADLNLKVKQNSLFAVVGKVGSGKSSLAHALIKELKRISGSIKVNGRISYVPQNAWLVTFKI